MGTENPEHVSTPTEHKLSPTLWAGAQGSPRNLGPPHESKGLNEVRDGRL